MSKGSNKNQCKFTSAQNPPTDFAIKSFILQYPTTKTLNGKIFKLYLLVSVIQFASCICICICLCICLPSFLWTLVENDQKLYITRKQRRRECFTDMSLKAIINTFGHSWREFLLLICTLSHKQTSSKWVIIIIVIYWMVELFYVISLSE